MHVFFKVYLLYTRMSLKSRKFDEVRVATLQSWPANGYGYKESVRCSVRLSGSLRSSHGPRIGKSP
jgi:hypothetical protein